MPPIEATTTVTDGNSNRYSTTVCGNNSNKTVNNDNNNNTANNNNNNSVNNNGNNTVNNNSDNTVDTNDNNTVNTNDNNTVRGNNSYMKSNNRLCNRQTNTDFASDEEKKSQVGNSGNEFLQNNQFLQFFGKCCQRRKTEIKIPIKWIFYEIVFTLKRATCIKVE